MKNKKRIIALDIFRGFLVFGMIVFHARLHLFASPLPEVFFHFIPAGFVMFSGVLLGKVLKDRKSGWSIFFRGLKLFLLFLFLNIPFWITNNISLYRIFVALFMGNPEISSFEVLLPISVLICISPLFLKIKYDAEAMIICIASILLLDIFQFFPYTGKLLLIGIFGLFFGKSTSLHPFLQDKKNIYSLVVTFLASAMFLKVFLLAPLSWTLQLCFVLLLFFWIPTALQKSSLATKLFFEFGKYSLILYIFHVALIKVLSFYDVFISHSPFFLIGEIFLITAICLAFIQLLKFLRAKSTFCQKCYLLIFR